MRFIVAKDQRAAIAVLVVLLIIAAALRFSMITRHFGHIDDLGVAATILEAEKHPPLSAQLIAEARRKEASGRGTPRTATMLQLGKSPAARAVVDMIAPIFSFVAVPLTWTYAPLPFLVTPLLIEPGQSYESIKFWGRLPSTLFALGAMLLMLLLARVVRPADPWPLGTAMIAPLAFSRELIVVSVQMHSYAATAFTAAAILFLTARDASQQDDRRGARFVLSRSILMFLFCYMSYQSLMLLPGYLAVLAWAAIRDKPLRDWPRKFSPSAVIGAAFVTAILPAYLFRLSTLRAIGWNAGMNREFLFSPDRVGDAILSAPAFLLGNGWLAFEALVTPTSPDTWISRVVSALILVAAAAGLVALILQARRIDDSRRELAKALLIYISVTLVLLILFILSGRLTLGPTRHLLLYLPLIAACAGIGLLAIARRTIGGREVAAAWLWSLGIGAVAFATFGAFAEARKDRFLEPELAALAAEARPDIIVVDGLSPEALLMPSLGEIAPTLSITDLASEPQPKVRRILFLSRWGPLSESDCATLWTAAGLQRILGACLTGTSITSLRAVAPSPEVEASQRTRNGGNGLFATLVILGPGRN